MTERDHWDSASLSETKLQTYFLKTLRDFLIYRLKLTFISFSKVWVSFFFCLRKEAHAHQITKAGFIAI